jgi:tetratricopeptide (TPR) repeat protein
VSEPETTISSNRIRILICLALGLITLALYLPSIGNGFVQYDDQQYVTENPRVQSGITWNGLKWAFGCHASNWHPLTWISHMADVQIFGARAGGHHLTNILLHAASTVLLFLLMERMTGFRWRSVAVAALFAWHPLHVESVAWIAERKDVLCGFFWMLTLFLYVRYASNPQRGNYLAALLAFALCLMSKPMGVTLPIVLMVLDVWPLKRWMNCDKSRIEFPRQTSAKLLLEKFLFLILVAGACVLTILAQDQAIVSTNGLPVSMRLAHSLVAYVHYAVAMFWPVNLAVYYPYDIHESTATVVLCGIFLTIITALVLVQFRKRPYLAAGWFWYIITLIPVIGLVQVGDQAWADRYTYLPFIGPFVTVVWLVVDLVKDARLLKMGGVLLGLLMLLLTGIQLQYWKSTRSLFQHAYDVTTDNYMALTVLGSELAREDKLDEAIADYTNALRMKPHFPEAHFYLANALEKQGHLDAAIDEYNHALWFRPTQEQTHIFLGMALGKQKKYNEAAEHYRTALKLNPDSAVTENNLARVLHTQGHIDEAAQHYRAALAINPKLALAHNNLGILLLQRGDVSSGITQLRDALNLNPTNAETQINLAIALNHREQWVEAKELFSKVVTPATQDPKIRSEFANALLHNGQTREAMSQYAAALLISQEFPEALEGLAWILSTSTNVEFRDGPEALKMAVRAVELTSKNDPVKLKTLAAAYAETGDFTNAVSTLKTALDVADKSGDGGKLSAQMRLMMAQFQASKPWRE